METRVLELIFINDAGKKTTISLNDPRENLTALEVQSAMETILDKNVFTSTGGDLAALSSARIVSRTVSSVYEAE